MKWSISVIILGYHDVPVRIIYRQLHLQSFCMVRQKQALTCLWGEEWDLNWCGLDKHSEEDIVQSCPSVWHLLYIAYGSVCICARVSSRGGGAGKLPPQTPQLPPTPQTDSTSPYPPPCGAWSSPPGAHFLRLSYKWLMWSY
jgi:hypothetical protein